MVNKHHQFPKEADKSFHGSSSASFLLGEQDDQIDGPWKSTQKNFKYLWLVFSSPAKPDSPVTLPPGCARLATKPAPTGSTAFVVTMGMVLVAPFAANPAGSPVTTIRSTFRRTNSAASSGRRPDFPSANRYSKVIFFPSIHPSLLSSCRNASTRTALPEQYPNPGNLCGRLFRSAARQRNRKAQRAWRKAQGQ